MKSLKQMKAELLAKAKVKAEYDALADEFAIAQELIAARTRAGLSQAEVARRMGTTQSVVARLESGRRTPSLRTVQRYAQAVGGRAVVRIKVIPRKAAA
ncbi:MAG: helix-turn-helix transcriptional regulator [Gammaproteobacteria bacterium]|nr:helix-turn-helix transcriptional regulator [Gammaproteobacteria bacterium]